MKTQGLYKGELFSTDISVLVAQIKKFQKTRCIYFQIWLLGGPSPPSQLVPNPFNWSPNTVFYRYLGNGGSNKKNQKTKSIYFLILLLAGLSSPSQLVPNPFNWSPNSVFSDISVSVAQIKKLKKQGAFFLLHVLLLGGHSPPSQLSSSTS